MTTLQKTRTAFTLIELLIVVAIIAILAAIAVPNFLEAQTRSKVSRCKSDMRTLKTGLEAYRVDYNRYIIDYNGRQGIPPQQAHDEYSTYVVLTTPVSYITSVFTSPFQNDEPQYDNNPYSDANVYEYWGEPFFSTFPPLAGGDIITGRLGVHYIVGALGPNLERDNWLVTLQEYVKLERGEAPVYDPTNGTVSDGDILTSNKVAFY